MREQLRNERLECQSEIQSFLVVVVARATLSNLMLNRLLLLLRPTAHLRVLLCPTAGVDLNQRAGAVGLAQHIFSLYGIRYTESLSHLYHQHLSCLCFALYIVYCFDVAAIFLLCCLLSQSYLDLVFYLLPYQST